MDPIPEKKKRGRKAKNVITEPSSPKQSPSIPKKRGRKPKGGKIILQPSITNPIADSKKNIILHLKCNLHDIKLSSENPTIDNNLENFQFSDNKSNDLNYMLIDTKISQSELSQSELSNVNEKIPTNDLSLCEINSTKNIWQKLEKLSTNLRYNNICDKKCACFFCTYDFDNNPIYIPKYELNSTYHVYGCFCSPECACAYLMEEKNLDSATRFERYYLLNYIYCKIYNYTKNIKPAPSPYYTLDKFYGNLSIQEYRKLLKNERLLLIVEKPLTRILPELHEDTEDYLLNNQNLFSLHKYNIHNFDVQKSKNEIVNKQFKLNA